MHILLCIYYLCYTYTTFTCYIYTVLFQCNSIFQINCSRSSLKKFCKWLHLQEVTVITKQLPLYFTRSVSHRIILPLPAVFEKNVSRLIKGSLICAVRPFERCEYDCYDYRAFELGNFYFPVFNFPFQFLFKNNRERKRGWK